jgi:hypothetical protein
MWSAPCPVLGNEPINTHSDNRDVFSTWSESCPVLGNWPMNTNLNTWHLFSLRSDPSLYNERRKIIGRHVPCGSGVEYLHRKPASRRRRRKGKSQIWESKMWSRVLRDSDPRKTTLARASSIYKRQTRPLVREGAPENQDRICQRVINIWSWAPDGAPHQDLLIHWPSVAMWLWLWLWIRSQFSSWVELS